MNCPGCSRANLPYLEKCPFCGEEIQDAEEAAVRREEWDRLPESAKEEFAREFKQSQARLEAHLTWLRKNRRVHAGIAAGMFIFPVSLAFFAMERLPFLSAVMVIVSGGVIGGVLGWYLNRIRGGAYQGAFLFGGGFGLWMGFLVSSGHVWGNPLTAICGLLGSLCIGYMFGTHLMLERTDYGG